VRGYERAIVMRKIIAYVVNIGVEGSCDEAHCWAVEDGWRRSAGDAGSWLA
jgi:hypothetical protein